MILIRFLRKFISNLSLYWNIVIKTFFIIQSVKFYRNSSLYFSIVKHDTWERFAGYEIQNEVKKILLVKNWTIVLVKGSKNF